VDVEGAGVLAGRSVPLLKANTMSTPTTITIHRQPFVVADVRRFPQCGQTAAPELICCPHSLHLISAIPIPPC
jgi:hypothetical protein